MASSSSDLQSGKAPRPCIDDMTPEQQLELAIARFIGRLSEGELRERLADLGSDPKGAQEIIRRRLRTVFKTRVSNGDAALIRELRLSDDTVALYEAARDASLVESLARACLHDSKGKGKGRAAPAAPDRPVPFDYYLVCDFEATCERDSPRDTYPHEIIEFPIVMVNARTLEFEDEFHAYVRPRLNPKLTEFCTELTGITQETVDKADTFSEVLVQVNEWLTEHNLHNRTGRSFAFVTDGPWDFRDFFTLQLRHIKSDGRPGWSTEWVNLRRAFPHFYDCERTNLQGMLSALGKEFDGRAHSGIDDTRNIARIAVQMIRDGALLKINDRMPSSSRNRKNKKKKRK